MGLEGQMENSWYSRLHFCVGSRLDALILDNETFRNGPMAVGSGLSFIRSSDLPNTAIKNTVLGILREI